MLPDFISTDHDGIWLAGFGNKIRRLFSKLFQNCCQFGYIPWPGVETVLRDNDLPLLSRESKYVEVIEVHMVLPSASVRDLQRKKVSNSVVATWHWGQIWFWISCYKPNVSKKLKFNESSDSGIYRTLYIFVDPSHRGPAIPVT